MKRQSAVVIASQGDPQARGGLIADAGAHGLPLVLRIGRMSGQLGHRVGGIIPKKQAAGYRVPDIPHDVGVAGEAGKAPPVLNLQLSLRAVEKAFLNAMGKLIPVLRT